MRKRSSSFEETPTSYSSDLMGSAEGDMAQRTKTVQTKSTKLFEYAKRESEKIVEKEKFVEAKRRLTLNKN